MPTFPQPTLHTARLTLRPFTPADAPRLREICNVREIAMATRSIAHPYELPMAEAWIAKLPLSWSDDTGAAFAITLGGEESVKTGKPIGHIVGSIGLMTSMEHRHAELGYLIGIDSWGCGYASEAARRAVQFGFEELKLERVHAHAHGNNIASCRVLEKSGMRHEGTLRRHILKWGEWHDAVMYGILKEEFAGGVSGSAGPHRTKL